MNKQLRTLETGAFFGVMLRLPVAAVERFSAFAGYFVASVRLFLPICGFVVASRVSFAPAVRQGFSCYTLFLPVSS